MVDDTQSQLNIDFRTAYPTSPVPLVHDPTLLVLPCIILNFIVVNMMVRLCKPFSNSLLQPFTNSDWMHLYRPDFSQTNKVLFFCH